jgi:hypothetical protein
VEAVGNWEALVRSNKYGALIRPSRGDAGFKQQLYGHLEQKINNSLFGLAFRAAQGVFDAHPRGNPKTPRTVIWLSDGMVDDQGTMSRAVREIKDQDIAIETIIFGRGDTEFAAKLELSPRRASSPAELMRAFAAAFRRVVQAPFDVDNLVHSRPTFQMRERVGEAWVVVYGDDTLGDVMIDTPAGTQPANYAQDSHPKAGAYRVYYAKNPPTGNYTVRANGGGAGAAYAVVQRSSLGPIYLEPRQTTAGVPVTVIAGVGAEGTAQALPGSDLPEGLGLDVTIEGKNYPMNDKGQDGDQKVGDGRYSAVVTFERAQRTPVSVRVRSPLLDKTIEVPVEVSGVFHYKGGPLTLDLGNISVRSNGRGSGEGCRDLSLIPAEHTGAIPFELKVQEPPPPDHLIEVRAPLGNLRARGAPVPIGPNEKLQVCLATNEYTRSSSASGYSMEISVAGTSAPDARVPIVLRWQVDGLSWFQWFLKKYGLILGGVLAVIVVFVVVLGYALPKTFQKGLAIKFAADAYDVEDAPASALAQFKVGIGFYRDAFCYLHPDFKVNQSSGGAMASLHAGGDHTLIKPAGRKLYRENGDWEEVTPQGRRTRPGDLYRADERGPYFKIVIKP